ncbi:hypothetical protein MMC14_002581 [Varicellaria rhodocarpa]|nr:hypothetical protein [Varicellaria rhodocarpa]
MAQRVDGSGHQSALSTRVQGRMVGTTLAKLRKKGFSSAVGPWWHPNAVQGVVQKEVLAGRSTRFYPVGSGGWRRGEKRDSTTTPYDPHTTRIPKAEAGSVDSYGFSPYSCLRDGCLTNAPRSGMLTYRRLIGLGVAIQYALRRPFVPTQTLSDYSTACPDVHLFWFDRKRSDPFEGPTDAVAEQTVLGEQGGLPTSIPFSPRVITIRAAKAVQQYLGRDHSSDDG